MGRDLFGLPTVSPTLRRVVDTAADIYEPGRADFLHAVICQAGMPRKAMPRIFERRSSNVGILLEAGIGNAKGESVQFYHFRRKPTHFFCSSFIFALLLLSNLYLRAYSIPEIVAKAKPAIVEIVAIDAAGAPMKFGTGFFISPDGLAVTNFHVIDGAASLKAIGTDGSIFAFQRLVAQGTGVDLALLQFQVTGVPFLRLGTSADKLEGERVIVIGNPTGFTGTVSDGVISAFREKRSMIQISAPISLGSSGSPVLDAGGRVIGVATLIAKEGQNLNFAIAVEQLSTVLSSQGIALPKAEITNQDVPGGTGRIARLTPTVLMVTAKSMNVTFQENGGSLVFFGNGRSVAASIAKPESTEIGHAIRLEPGLTRSSTGEWYLPYPLALTIQAFLDPDIRPEFAPDHFYLVNASGSQESQKTETLMSALSRVNPKLFIIPERTEQVPTARAVQLFVRIIPPQTGGPDCAVSAMIFALPGPVDQKDLWISEDIQLSSILAEKLLEGFAFHPAAVSSVSGTVLVGNVPQAWDIPMLGIDFQLTEAGYSSLSKDNFNEVASALTEGLRSFKDERAWSRSSSVVPPPRPSPTPYKLAPQLGLPSEVKVYLDSGLASFDKQDYDKAISDFTEAIRLDPNYALAYLIRGVAYGNEGHADKAIIDFSEGIRLDPNIASAYYNRGVAYEKKGNLDKAISDYNEAIRLDPNYAPAYINRGKLYLHTGNRAKANADFATARRLKAGQ